MPSLEQIYKKSSSYHSHLCPRQVLGARIGLAGARALGLELSRVDKRLLVIVETVGCFPTLIASSEENRPVFQLHSSSQLH